MIELVDFNEVYGVKEEAKTKTRRSRRGSGKVAGVTAAETDSIEEAVIVDEVVAEEPAVEAASEEVVAEEPATEEASSDETSSEGDADASAEEEKKAE
jgi:hypothetical protein